MLNQLKRFGLPLMLIAGLAVLSGCEDDDEAFFCEIDDDCDIEGDICVSEQCIPTCEEQADCGLDQDCKPVEERDDDAQICKEVEFEFCDEDDDCGVDQTCEPHPFDEDESDVCEDVPMGLDCDENEDCRSDEFCDSTQDPQDDDFLGTCNDIDDLAFYTVLIQDETREFGQERSSGAAACDDSTFGYETAGAKLMYVELVDGEDNVISYGQLVDFEVGDNADFGFPFDIFTGDAPPYSGTCPDDQTFNRAGSNDTVTSNLHEDAVFAMGCDGWLGLQFRDEDDNLIPLDDSMAVNVGEFGPSCNDVAQTGDDAFDIYLCHDRRPEVLDRGSCEMEPQNDTPASGIFFQEISLPTFD